MILHVPHTCTLKEAAERAIAGDEIQIRHDYDGEPEKQGVLVKKDVKVTFMPKCHHDGPMGGLDSVLYCYDCGRVGGELDD